MDLDFQKGGPCLYDIKHHILYGNEAHTSFFLKKEKKKMHYS